MGVRGGVMRSSRDPDRIAFARDQRKQANEFADDVWQMIRARKVLGYKFRREHPLGPYTVDFVCLELKLIVEVDGKDMSEEGMTRDRRRDRFLNEQGLMVMHINGYDVIRDGQAVRWQIESALAQRAEEVL